jgi:hypothetical protein
MPEDGGLTVIENNRYTAPGQANVGILVNESVSSTIACPAFGARLQFL